jgi:hypothetical protein
MIADTYATLIADLTTGLAVTGTGVPGATVHTAWPDGLLSPPACIVAPPPGQWVTPSDFFGGYTVHVDILCLVSESLTALAGLVECVLRNTADWGLTEVDAVGGVPIGGVPMLGCLVHLSKQSKL